jgi:hypothetical protein
MFSVVQSVSVDMIDSHIARSDVAHVMTEEKNVRFSLYLAPIVVG